MAQSDTASTEPGPADLVLVEAARGRLAVARDEGHGRTAVQKLQGRLTKNCAGLAQIVGPTVGL